MAGDPPASDEAVDYGLYTICLLDSDRSDTLKLWALAQIALLACLESDPPSVARVINDAARDYLRRIRAGT